MILKRSKFRKLFLVCGLVLVVLGTALSVARKSPELSLTYLGVRETFEGPRAFFVMSNSLPYGVYWLVLDPEFELESGWTVAELPTVPEGERVRPGNPEPLAPGMSWLVFGASPTNVAHRVPVLWEMSDADAMRRPQWKRVADEWAERIGLQSFLRPYRLQRSPVVPAMSPDGPPGESATAAPR